MSIRTAAYLRYSSDIQRGESIRDQLRNIENYCKSSGWPLPVVFKDEAISGARTDRPGYIQLLSFLESGLIDVLLVDDISRLSRDNLETVTITKKLAHLKVRLIGVSDGTDNARDNYKLEVGLRGLLSELYLDELAAKTHRGLTGLALQGYSAGGLPYGYDSVKLDAGFKKSVNEDQARWVRYIFERFAIGANCRQIASELNEKGVPGPRGGTWAHSALYPDSKGVGMIANEIYIGRQVWNKTKWIKSPETGRRLRQLRPKEEWVITENPELAIIDQELWDECQKIITAKRGKAEKLRAKGKKSMGGGPSKYLFSGLLKCGKCGGAYVIQTPTQYGCATHKDRGPAVCKNSARIKRDDIEDIFLEKIKSIIIEESFYNKFEKMLKSLIKKEVPLIWKAKRKLAASERARNKILDAIKMGIITEGTKKSLEDCEADVRFAEVELRRAEEYEVPEEINGENERLFCNLVRNMESIKEKAALKNILSKLIGEIKIFPKEGSLATAVFESHDFVLAKEIFIPCNYVGLKKAQVI